MKRKRLLIACCALLSVDSMIAQSGSAPADPLSGVWSGYMEPDETQRQPITVTLKFDGNALSGTITGPPYPGDIKSGTFDPVTGALKFEVVVRDDSKTVVVFEGKVAQGSAAGRVSFNNRTGTFNIAKQGAGTSAAAPPKAAAEASTAAARRNFADVSGQIMKAAALVPADKYTYRPTQSVRTVGQLLAHIADGYNYFCATAAGRKVEWSDSIEKGNTDKATLAQKLEQSTDACAAAYGGPGQIGALIDNVAHTNLHYGNIITYMRMLGLVPPSS
jgi:hypothetical protein